MTREQAIYQFNFILSNATEKLKEAMAILDGIPEEPQCPYASKPKWDNRRKEWDKKDKVYKFK